MFSDDGATLLGCANDGLHVIGWEPARVLDTVPGHWGNIHDLTVAQTQLVSRIYELTKGKQTNGPYTCKCAHIYKHFGYSTENKNIAVKIKYTQKQCISIHVPASFLGIITKIIKQ